MKKSPPHRVVVKGREGDVLGSVGDHFREFSFDDICVCLSSGKWCGKSFDQTVNGCHIAFFFLKLFPAMHTQQENDVLHQLQVRPGKPGRDALAHTVAVLWVLGRVVSLCCGIFLQLLALVDSVPIFFCALP